jgi:hypothetical protein
MKKIIVAVLFAGCSTSVFSQGLVNFFNNATTLISASDTVMQGTAGAYYFGLLIAPAGTRDFTLFTFSGAYGTNQATAGRFSGARPTVISNWPAGTTMAFMVAGWSADAGHDWNPGWLSGYFGGFPGSQIGFSEIAEGAAGGFDGTGNIPSLNVFSVSTINSGFNLERACIGPYFWGLNMEPRLLTIARGAAAHFQVTVNACPLPRYQWYFNGIPIPGATASGYGISGAQPEHAGNYYAILTGSWGFYGTIHQSPTATLTVIMPPAITAQPQPRTAEQGSGTRFSVRATADPPLTCQWFFNGNVDLTGVATNSSLQLTNLQFSQSGAYTVVLSNLAGAITSTPAMLSVIPVVPRRMVPGLLLAAEPATLVNIDYTPQLQPPDWQSFPAVYLTNSPQFYFDLSSPMPAQRFYRVWQAGAPSVVPSVSLPGMVPAISLTGTIGSSLRIDCINQFGPTNAWATLTTVQPTDTSQLYFDTNSIGQPPRLYRVVPSP